MDDKLELAAPQKVAIFKKKGRVIGLLPVHDYIYRPHELAEVNLYDWIWCYKREKARKNKDNLCESTDLLGDDIGIGNLSVDAEPDIDLMSDVEGSAEEEGASTMCQGQNTRSMSFKKEHPLSDSNVICYVKDNLQCVPNFVGANLLRCDHGDCYKFIHHRLSSIVCNPILILFIH